MAVSFKLKNYLPRLKSLLQLQRFNHKLVEEELEAELLSALGPKTMVASGHVDTSKWKKMDSRTFGLTLSMVPEPPRIIVRILQNEGYDAYLVGGCVRDLLLNKIPKDFDVITTADLKEIKKTFHRAYIVGRRFPICRVHVRGSAIEVSSFETVAGHAKKKDDIHLSEMPKGYDEKDFMRWRNSLYRDFTINSLFYDPFAHKIYDYSNGMTDLTSMKLQTLVPAHLSFQEDCARILRGIRLAARVGLSFEKDTEKAIHILYASVKTLDKGRLMMEMNYMLSYGASEPSLILLKRFKLLEVLLPFHAVYLANHSDGQALVMLMKLFFNLDNVVSCDQPCDSSLWVCLLAFHLALVNNPQEALVIWTFCSLLYHGKWKAGVNRARELAEEHVNFVPEILESCNDVTDEELAQRVANLASIVRGSIDALTDSQSLLKAMGRYPSSSCSGLVFISKNAGREAAEIFNVLVDDIETLMEERRDYTIDYGLLGKGDIRETRFVLGKIIMDTMTGGITEKKYGFFVSKPKIEQLDVEKPTSMVFELEEPQSEDRAEQRLGVPDDQPKKRKKSKKMPSALEQKLGKEKLGQILNKKMPSAKKKQQIKKVVVKDIEKLLSLQEEVTPKDAKLRVGKHREPQAPRERECVLERRPKLVKQHEPQDPKVILSVLENTPAKVKQHKAGGPKEIWDVLQKTTSKMTKQHETQPSMGGTLRLSKLFQEHTKDDDDEPKKKQKVGEQPRYHQSKEIHRIRNLSSIFK